MAITLNGTTGITSPDINVTAQTTGFTTTGNLTAADLTLSGGVYLGGTGAANYLDDYEEGTWTPAATVGFPAGFTDVSANYVKVGSMVLAVAYFRARNDGTSIQIGGLPFLPSSYYGWSLGHEAYTVRKEYMDATNSRLYAVLSGLSGASYYDFYVSATYRTNS